MTDAQKRIGTAGAAAVVAAGMAYGAYNFMVSPSSDCPPWVCGLNSAQVIGYTMQLDGQPNEDGYRIAGFETRNADGQTIRYDLDEAHARFVDEHGGAAKLDVMDGRFILRGEDGARKNNEETSKLVFERKGKRRYDITIEGMDTVQSWAQPAGHTPKMIPTYLFDSPFPGSARTELCSKKARWAEPGEMSRDTSLVASRWHEETFHAVLLAGDTYDTRNVRVNPGDRSVSLACAGSALAKMKLMGYDPEIPAGNDLYTTREQRQTTLKMITATYCETGKSRQFTQDGVPLAWLDAHGWFAPPWDLVRGVEARWNSRGATCLGEPRLLSRARVEKLCGAIPRCPPLATPAPASSYPLEGNEWASFTRGEPSPDVLAKK